MFAVEISFGKRDGAGVGALEAANAYVAALERNGNVLSGWIMTVKEGGWTVYGVAPDRDAFKVPSQSSLVRQRLNELKRSSVNRPRTRLLNLVPETAVACRCATPSAYFLFTTFLHTEPPVWCIDCNGIVPLYRLPCPAAGDFSRLLAWQNDYQACDTLQINCTVGERFAELQMSDLDSALNRSGLALCSGIHQQTGRPVYYYLFRANGRSGGREMQRKCPRCGGGWRLSEPLYGKFDFKCDECCLLSNIAWNVR